MDTSKVVTLSELQVENSSFCHHKAVYNKYRDRLSLWLNVDILEAS